MTNLHLQNKSRSNLQTVSCNLTENEDTNIFSAKVTLITLKKLITLTTIGARSLHQVKDFLTTLKGTKKTFPRSILARKNQFASNVTEAGLRQQNRRVGSLPIYANEKMQKPAKTGDLGDSKTVNITDTKRKAIQLDAFLFY